jgi:flagellar biosynthesis/type III secretory pathway protein FliH
MGTFTPLCTQPGFSAGLIAGESRDIPRDSFLDGGLLGPGRTVGDPDTAMAIADAEAQMGRHQRSTTDSDAPGTPGSDDAESILPKTIDELAELVGVAEEEARAAVTEALAEERATVAAQKAALVHLLDEVKQAREMWAKEVRETLGELLLTGIRQVVGDSAELQTSALQERLVEVGQRLVGEQEVMVRVRQEDAEMVEELISDRAGWRIMVDDGVGSGGLVAETPGGKVDASMGAAIAGVAGAVREWIDEVDVAGEDT